MEAFARRCSTSHRARGLTFEHKQNRKQAVRLKQNCFSRAACFYCQKSLFVSLFFIALFKILRVQRHEVKRGKPQSDGKNNAASQKKCVWQQHIRECAYFRRISGVILDSDEIPYADIASVLIAADIPVFLSVHGVAYIHSRIARLGQPVLGYIFDFRNLRLDLAKAAERVRPEKQPGHCLHPR